MKNRSNEFNLKRYRFKSRLITFSLAITHFKEEIKGNYRSSRGKGKDSRILGLRCLGKGKQENKMAVDRFSNTQSAISLVGTVIDFSKRAT